MCLFVCACALRWVRLQSDEGDFEDLSEITREEAAATAKEAAMLADLTATGAFKFRAIVGIHAGMHDAGGGRVPLPAAPCL